MKKNESFPKITLPRISQGHKFKLFFQLCGKCLVRDLSQFFNTVLGARKQGLGFAAFAIIAVSTWGFLSFNTPTYRDHLNNANQALSQLKSIGDNTIVVNHFSLLTTAYANEDGVDEALVQELTDTVVEETEAAIETAENINNTAETAEALAAINEIQDETIEVLADVIDLVESNEALETIADAIELTEEQNQAIETVTVEVVEALEMGTTEVTIDIETTEDKEINKAPLENNTEKFESAKKLFKSLQTRQKDETFELSDSMQKKMISIEKALIACEKANKTSDCKPGRIKGLSIALNVKLKKEIRKNTKEVPFENKKDNENKKNHNKEIHKNNSINIPANKILNTKKSEIKNEKNNENKTSKTFIKKEEKEIHKEQKEKEEVKKYIKKTQKEFKKSDIKEEKIAPSKELGKEIQKEIRETYQFNQELEQEKNEQKNSHSKKKEVENKQNLIKLIPKSKNNNLPILQSELPFLLQWLYLSSFEHLNKYAEKYSEKCSFLLRPEFDPFLLHFSTARTPLLLKIAPPPLGSSKEFLVVYKKSHLD